MKNPKCLDDTKLRRKNKIPTKMFLFGPEGLIGWICNILGLGCLIGAE